MSKSNLPVDCSGIMTLLMQKRSKALVNIPPTRFSLVSPYPNFTQSQLDMRRKAEILKYNNNQQNTKTNNLTKKELWSLLSKGKTNSKISQYTVSNINGNTCISDVIKPTLTSSCDVPGSLIYLHYDPDVPLYNYNIVRTFGIEPNSNLSLWNAYTINILEFLVSNSRLAYSDKPNIFKKNTLDDSSGSNLIQLNSINNIVVGQSVFATCFPTGTTVIGLGNGIDNIISISNATTIDISAGSIIRFRDLTSQTTTRTSPLGSILITDYMNLNRYSFNLSFPLGIWVYGIYGNGIQDTSGNTLLSPITINSYDTLNINITSMSLIITYNGISITNTGVNVSYSNTQLLSIKGSNIPYQETFYGIQYIGMVNISGLNLQTQPGNLYDISLKVSYTYDTSISSKFDLFQSGIFTNIPEENKNTCSSNFKFNSTPYSVYSSGSFTPFTV